MASNGQSPVMVEQPSSPTTNAYGSPEFSPSALSPTPSTQQHTPIVTSSETMNQQNPAQESVQPSTSETETQTEQEQVVASETSNDADDSSNSESNSDSSTSTETPGTISTPRSSAHDSGQPVPESQTTQLDTQPTEPPSTETTTTTTTSTEIPETTAPVPESPPESSLIPPPPDPPYDNTPSWVIYEEDTSTPTEDELKAIEADKTELDAADTHAIEKDVFSDVDDPDLRPSKKIRLSWTIKGVRGTKDKPNRARIMTSPSVCIDGYHWNIKFFPRGNKSRNSLAAYIRCSTAEPPPCKDDLVGSFKAWHTSADGDLSKVEPICDMPLTIPEIKEDISATQSDEAQKGESEKPKEHRRRSTEGEDEDSISGDEDDRPDRSESLSTSATVDDYRVSAQLGLAIYNPQESRTCYTSSASHQFYPHQDDWGWDTAVSHWEDIHRRKHGQRQALLRNDTLTVDAYIRVYDDPTKALFWHPSTGESQWDSKGLAGVFPVGTRLLYHSPATAGIIAWSLLAPFRSVVQSIEAGAWRKDSAEIPRPLTAHLQLMLFQMRHMKKEELYVRLDNVVHEITRSGENYDNVTAFWEAFRRAIEIETASDGTTKDALYQIFGSRERIRKLPLLPVADVSNMQESALKAFKSINYQEPLPDFLPLTFKRQSFDFKQRQWQMHNDRVRISENLDLNEVCAAGDNSYTLYGFIVHDGDRTSGKFFSVLRPNGPGGKWLVFSDGNGNKVFSYTRKKIEEYEGLEGAELKKSTSTQQTIHTALFVRTSRLSDYLVPAFEPFKLPFWLKKHLDETYHYDADMFGEPDDLGEEKPISVEIFWDKSVGGQEGKLDLYKLKTNAKARDPQYRQIVSADREATIGGIKAKIAEALHIDEVAFKLWAMNHHRLGGVSKGYMYVLPAESVVVSCLNTSLHLSLWMTIVPKSYELEDDVLAANFKAVGGIHIEAPPKPEPPAVTDLTPNTDEVAVDVPIETTNESATSTSVPGNHETNEAGPDAEQASVQDAVTRDVGESSGDQSLPVAVAVVSQTDQANDNNHSTEASADIAAAPDAEQESVREAVQLAVNEPSESRSVSLNPAEQVEASSASGEVINRSVESETILPEPVPLTQDGSSSGPVVQSDLDTHTDRLPRTPSDLPTTPSEPAEVPANIQDFVEQITDVNSIDSNLPPVLHGHLFDASSHAEPQLTLSQSHESQLSHGEPPLPVGIPIAIGNDQIILVQANQDEISAEDAALISSMIAADIEAAEQDHVHGETANNADGEADSDGEEDVVDSRPVTPRQRIPDVYGFLHVFDAENQKFTVHSTFSAPRDTTISTLVRTQMGYDEEKSFHLWKRDGTYRTVGVSLETTFQAASLVDCCEVIVGDHLGEMKMEALKAEAKYIDPGQLMRYLAMVHRGHPTSALTSEEPVEIAEFGGEYYKGPLLRGQRHGKSCSLITQGGDSYEGPLVAGQKSGGKGKMVFQNGDIYDGDWLDDMKHGQGEFLEKRTGNRYVGGYESDKRWGKGVTYWEQADQQAALCQVCFFEDVDALFYKCGHVVACYSCAKRCASDSNGCPVCRKPIEAVVKMYRS